MARISGINVPDHKHVWVSLKSIYGVGHTRTFDICKTANVDPYVRMGSLSDEALVRLRSATSAYTIEGDLRREKLMNIKRLLDLGCYRGIRIGDICRLEDKEHILMQERAKVLNAPSDDNVSLQPYITDGRWTGLLRKGIN